MFFELLLFPGCLLGHDSFGHLHVIKFTLCILFFSIGLQTSTIALFIVSSIILIYYVIKSLNFIAMPISTCGCWNCSFSNSMIKLCILKALPFRNGVCISQHPIQDSLLCPEFCFLDSAALVTQLFLCQYLQRNKKKVILEILFPACSFKLFSPAVSVSSVPCMTAGIISGFYTARCFAFRCYELLDKLKSLCCHL